VIPAPENRNWAPGDICLYYTNGKISHAWLVLSIESCDNFKDTCLFLDLYGNFKFKAYSYGWDFRNWEFFPITTD
jgi:hypothetical protein